MQALVRSWLHQDSITSIKSGCFSLTLQHSSPILCVMLCTLKNYITSKGGKVSFLLAFSQPAPRRAAGSGWPCLCRHNVPLLLHASLGLNGHFLLHLIFCSVSCLLLLLVSAADPWNRPLLYPPRCFLRGCCLWSDSELFLVSSCTCWVCPSCLAPCALWMCLCCPLPSRGHHASLVAETFISSLLDNLPASFLLNHFPWALPHVFFQPLSFIVSSSWTYIVIRSGIINTSS